MAKKKMKRRMKKQVRKTLGALFLASAVAVAAIPVGSYDGGSAAASNSGEEYVHEVKSGYYDDSNKEHSTKYGTEFKNPSDITALRTVYSDGSTIPLCKTDSTIYTTGDGDFQFAYVDSNGDEDGAGSKFAVILGYDHSGNLDNGTLKIDNEVDAYLNYNDNDASRSAYCAVGKAGNFLFYETTDVGNNYYTEDVQVEQNKLKNGMPVYKVYSQAGILYSVSEDGITQAEIDRYVATGDIEAGYRADPIMETVTVEKQHYFAPCYYDSKSNWDNLNLYYFPTKDSRPSGVANPGALKDKNDRVIPQMAASDGDYGRIIGAPVVYIGKQYLTSKVEDGRTTGWTIAGEINEGNGTERGIFANNSNITTLVIGNNLSGLSDYAFYGCAVGSVTLGNGLNALGNHTFDECTSLRTVIFEGESNNLQTIGAYCFNQCRNLQTFNLPLSVRSIGDGAFKGCSSMTSIDLLANGNGLLKTIGSYVFQNCAKLESLTFPSWYGETLELSEFEGCKSLQWIKSENADFNVVSSESCNFTWQAFQDEWNGGDAADIETRDKFYLEAPNKSGLHTTATENEVAFRYFETDTYEVTKKETSFVTDDVVTVTYKLENSGTLTETVFHGPVTSLSFPGYIGPNKISKIGSGAFQDKCTLTEITFDESIVEIGAAAFQGCHNLKYAIFENDNVQIGANAFMTQKMANGHSSDCQEYPSSKPAGAEDTKKMLYAGSNMTDSSNYPNKQLCFVGTIGASSSPYRYAMSYEGRYSNDNQKLSFVDFLSGWPTMLTVQYHYDTATGTGYSELVDFPTMKNMTDYSNAEYLTEDQQKAASEMLSTPEANRSLYQEYFYNALTSLTIPDGVDAIQDGLYVSKTEGGNPFPVTCNGLKKIEVNYVTDNSGNILYFEDDSDTSGTTNPPDDRNYFPRADAAKSDFAGATALNEIYISGDVTTIDPYSFQGDVNLKTVDITSPIKEIGDHAFEGDTSLEDVNISDTLTSFGIAPFKGCTSLTTVSLGDNSNFACEDSIIYSTSGGKGIVEVLPGRTQNIWPAEMGSDIVAVAEEAFATSQVKVVDLTGTSITTLPTHAFYDAAAESSRVSLPDSCTTVEPYAFENSKVNEIKARSVVLPEATMLDGIIVNGGKTDSVDTSRNKQVTVNAPEDSYMYTYAVRFNYTPDPNMEKDSFTVKFYGYDAETKEVTDLLNTTSVEDGSCVEDKDITYAKSKAVQRYEAEASGFYYELDGWKDSRQNVLSDADLISREITADTEFYGNYVVRYGEMTTYKVSFKDYYENVLEDYTYTVAEGNTLEQEQKKIPQLADVTEDGITYTHQGWKSSGELSVTDPITRDVTFDPIYSKKEGLYRVEFDYIDPVSGSLEVHLVQENVVEGTDLSKSVSDPKISESGYTFNGWSSATTTPSTGDISNVTCDFRVVGTFTSNSSGSGSADSSDSSGSDSGDSSSSATKPGGGSNETVQINGFTIPAYDTEIFAVALYYDANGNPYSYRLINIGSKAPDVEKPEGYSSGYAWSPTPTETTVNDVAFFNLVPYTPSSSGNSTTTTDNSKFYTLTVVGGSGSGSYKSGSTVIIVANDPASGQEFSNWTVDPSSATLASKVMSATTIAMPEENVTVTAHYKAKSASTTVSGNSSNNNSGRATSTGTVSGGTTVVIDKNGLSNTGVVSATVRGSSDNFTIKIKESSDASTAIVKALQAEYGDISNIKYFPMDISLYDATGTKKITDTTGLSISITLPIPDSLIPYAGNNKVAGVVNNRLDKLTPKFTTIDKVACMTFTAEHFSPYVIYVDTASAAAGGNVSIADNTPKTGDGIHPKWFLSIGLACISAVLFLKRDKKVAQKVTA